MINTATYIIDPNKMQTLTIQRNGDNLFNLIFESVKQLTNVSRGYYQHQEEKNWKNEMANCKIKSIKIEVEEENND